MMQAKARWWKFAYGYKDGRVVGVERYGLWYIIWYGMGGTGGGGGGGIGSLFGNLGDVCCTLEALMVWRYLCFNHLRICCLRHRMLELLLYLIIVGIN